MTESEMQRSLSALRAIIPPLTHASHKGTAGRIGVVGGSLEYTGAPYLAAMSAMRARKQELNTVLIDTPPSYWSSRKYTYCKGADLGHVFCPEAAATVIKSYSPELIVHPLLSDRCSESSEAIASWLPRLHALVIGPGLGRDPAIMNTVKSVIAVAKQQNKDIVIDADGLYLVTTEPEVVMGYPRAILTPNAAEFQRLHEKVLGSPPSPDGDPGEQTKVLAAEMGNLVIVQKGHVDTISDGHQVVRCCEEGCPRRCGGQGDLLSGTVGLFSHWARQSEQQYHSSQPLPPLLVAAYGGCFLVKKCAQLAYSKHHRSMLAGDMVLEIPTVFQTLLEPVTNTNQ